MLDIEKLLKGQLPQITLLGQIPLSDCDAQILRETITREAARDFSRIKELGHLSFSCFMVWVGIKHYDHGTYWANVENYLGLSGGNRQQMWGEIFLDTLYRYKLTIFPDSTGHRYVTPILLHGGIPDSCLQDFFECILYPIVNGKLDVELNEPQQIIAELRGTSHYQRADKPVQRFLADGGKPAMDLLNRCLELALAAYYGKPIPPVEELGLPKRVVQRFEQWWQAFRQQLLPESRLQLSRPWIERTPYGEVRCVLPEQSIPKGDDASFIFQVFGDERQVCADELSTYIMANGVLTERAECYLPPASGYRVCLLCNAQPLREWSFNGVSAEGWIAFDSKGLLIRRNQLPHDLLWLVFDNELDLDAGVHIHEETRGDGEWERYQFCLVDATDVESLSLFKDNGQILLPLASGKVSELCGESSAQCHVKGLAVYTSQLPTIRIPINQPEETNQWDVLVEDMTTQTSSRKWRALTEVSDRVTDRWAQVRLSHQALLGEPRLGEFRVKLRSRGALGQDKQFRFAFVKDLNYKFDRPFYLVTENPRLTLLTDPSLKIRPEESSVEIVGEDGCFGITIKSESRSLNLNLEENQDRKLPLTFTFPRLRWAVRGLETHSFRWHSEPYEIHLEVFDSSNDATLVLQLPVENSVSCTLELEGANQKSEGEIRHGEVRFSLGQFCDSLRGLSSNLAKFYVSYVDPLYEEQRICPLLVRTRWTVEGFESLDTRTVLFCWNDGGRYRNRHLRLWNLSQPWQEPKEHLVPDGNTEIEIREPLSSLPSGKYRVELFLSGEFNTALPLLPPQKNESNVFDILLGEDQLSSGAAPPASQFRQHLIRRLGGPGYLEYADLSKYVLTQGDFDDLTRTLIFLTLEERQQEATNLWFRDLRQQIREVEARNNIRNRIKSFAEGRNDKLKGLLLSVCKVIGLTVNSLIPFEVNSSVLFENQRAIFAGIRKWEQQKNANPGVDPWDLICLKYPNAAALREINLSRLSEIHPAH